jgi:hypothetical protein
MKTQELKIEAPEGYEVDWDNSSNNVIRFKPIEKKITYKDICRELFLDKPSWKLTDSGVAKYANCTSSAVIHHSSISTSNKQLEQLLALNKLMNVAKYLNGDWKPNWNDEFEDKIYFYYSSGKLNICAKRYSNFGCVCFKTIDLAHQAVEILGKEEVKKALGVFD